jgi:phospholipid transport system substrate-binding protein
MNLRNRIMVFTIILVLFSFHPVKAKQSVQQPVTPTEHIITIINEALPYLQAEGMDRNSRWQRVWKVLHQHFDFRSLTQNVLAKHWNTATLEEQHQIIVFFSQYLEIVYRASIEAYKEQRIEYLGEQINEEYAVVNIAITEGQETIPVTFQLRDQYENWMIYDVIINGVSIIDSYRATFNAIIKTEGMNGLMDEIAEKIGSYNKRHGIDQETESSDISSMESTP